MQRQISQTSVRKTIDQRPVEEGLQGRLEGVVFDVVQALDYAGAMVATYEQGDVLPVRAFYLDPEVIRPEQLNQLEQEISDMTGYPVSMSDPSVARVSVFDSKHAQNLSIKAINAGRQAIEAEREAVLALEKANNNPSPEAFAVAGEAAKRADQARYDSVMVSKDMFDLFRPILPDIARPIVSGIQAELNVEEVVAVPFFLGDEVVGNLFAMKRGKIRKQDKLILAAFGRQAAAAIEGESRRLQANLAQKLILQLQTDLGTEMSDVLQNIAEGVVTNMGFAGAAVAAYNREDDALPIHGFYVNENIATMSQIRQWEQQISNLDPDHPVSITDPRIARVYVNDPYYKDNLSTRAAQKQEIVTSTELFDLFTPIIPAASLNIIRGIQDALDIKLVIAVPFFLGDEFVGNLFAASRSRSLSRGERELLEAFGAQAAAGIYNARLYYEIQKQREVAEEQRKAAEEQREAAEEQREVALVFGKMAFSASKSVHNFRNHIGFIRGQLQLFNYLDQVDENTRQEILQSMPRIMARLDKIAEILNQLHEPWVAVDDKSTNVNTCLTIARDKVIPDHASEGIQVEMNLDNNLPDIFTSPDMLTESFRIILKNAVEAIKSRDFQGGHLQIRSYCQDDQHIIVEIHDNGIGISPENIEKVFDLRWSTKETGLGFGLFWTRDFVEGIGGHIDVVSTQGEGTTFRITLRPNGHSQENIEKASD